MDVVYALGRATAHEVRDAMPDAPSYSTVRALLRVLETKGHVTHVEDGPRYIYIPTVTRAKARAKALTHIVNTFFDDHKRKGFARYDSAAPLSPVHQEIWAHKTCDHYQTVKPGLSVIEGIYGRDGDGFGVGNDHLTNIVIFGQDRLRMDMVGMYLGGHEPGNVNLFRIAKERGLCDTINPWEVELYEWVNRPPE